MRRWHEDYKIAYREWRKHHKSHIERNKDNQYGFGYDRIGRDPYEVDCVCDTQVGRFRKKDAWDCGNTRCGICHNDKFPKRIKHEQEILSEISFREQLKDFYEG